MNIFFKTGKILFNIIAVFIILVAILLENVSKLSPCRKDNPKNKEGKMFKTSKINPRLKNCGY